MAKDGYNAFKMAQEQFDRTADMLNLEDSTRDLLRNPLREYHFLIPVKMDDGRIEVFTGWAKWRDNT